LEILDEKGEEPESFCAVLMNVRLSVLPSVQPLLATGTCTLKRTGGRLSVQA